MNAVSSIKYQASSIYLENATISRISAMLGSKLDFFDHPGGGVGCCRHRHRNYSCLFDTLPFLIVDSERKVFERVFFQRAVLYQRFQSAVDALE